MTNIPTEESNTNRDGDQQGEYTYGLRGIPDTDAPSLADELPGDAVFDVMAFGGQSTVAAATPTEGRRSTSYQSEAELEAAFVKQLQRQGYEYVRITSEAELIANSRRQIEALNRIEFTDKEWSRFFKQCIAADNEGIVEKTRRIQEDHVQAFRRDDGTVRNVQLIDKRNVHNNRLQVINQYAVDAAESGAVGGTDNMPIAGLTRKGSPAC